MQAEVVDGQSNQNPSEYVSNGVLPAPYHGAGVDGVQYFNTLNGNTVSSNVVTAGTGAPINSSTSKFAQLPGASGSDFSTPDATANRITGDIDVRVKAMLSDWTPATYHDLVGKWVTTGNQRSYHFYVNPTNGLLTFGYSTDGTAPGIVNANSTVAPTVSDGNSLYLRATRVSATGVVTFYTSADGASWTQLGATVSGATGAMFNGAGTLEVGAINGAASNPIAGNIYRAQIYNGINGTLAVDFNPNTWSSGSTWKSATTNEQWTINGNASVFAGTGLWDSTGPLGFFAEDTRTNGIQQSQTLNTTWTQSQVSVTADQIAAPDGTLTADLITGTSGTAIHRIVIGSSSGATGTGSFYIKAGTSPFAVLGLVQAANEIWAAVNMSTGVITQTGATGGSTYTSSSITALPNGWYRVTLTGTLAITPIALNLSLSDTGTPGAATPSASTGTTVYAWGGQLEDGATFASSYIPTTSASATRNADTLTYQTAGNVSGTAGTAYAEVMWPQASDNANRAIDLDAAGNRPAIAYRASATSLTIYDGTLQTDTPPFSFSSSVQRVAGVWGGGTIKSVNGGVVGGTAVFDGNMNVGTNMGISGPNGVGGSQPFGTIRNVKIWKKALTNLQLATMTNTSTAVARAAVPQTSTVAASLNPTFQANLTNTLKLDAGSGSPTFTRATTAYQTDFEGKLNQTLSGEARFQGARRVQNLIQASENLNGTGWSAYGGNGTFTEDVTAPDGTLTGWRVVANSGGGGIIATPATPSSLTHTGTTEVWLRAPSGTVSVSFSVGQGNEITLTLDTTWRRYSMTGTFQQTSRVLNIFNPSGAAFEFWMWHPQTEDVTGQTNQNPSEYVSTGVLPAPYHGAGADCVQYFNTLNGNTVASNIVTEKTGAKITSAQSAAAGGVTAGVVDATGPLGYLAEGARTNLALYSQDQTNAAWLDNAGTTHTGNSVVGPDGTTSGATVNHTTNVNDAFYQNYTFSAATYTLSVYAKAGTGGNTFTLGFFDGSHHISSQQTLTNVWTRYSYSVTTSAGAGSFSIRPGVPGTAQTFYIWGAQLEAGSFASSYIPTTSASVTRNADLLTYPSSGNVSGTVGTTYLEFTQPNALDSYALSWRADTNSYPVRLAATQIIQQDTSSNLLRYKNPYTQSSTVAKVATAWGGTTQIGTYNGDSIVSQTFDGNMQIQHIGVGGDANTGIYGTIRNVKIWKKVLTNLQLQTMTNTSTAVARAAVPKPATVNASTNNSLTNGLVGLWSFDGKDISWGATPTVYDRSGSGNNGTTTGMTAATSATIGKIGQALKFDGTSFVNVTNTTAGNLTSGTLAAWVNPTTLTPGSSGCNIHNGSGNCMAIFFNDNDGYFFAINSDGALDLDLGNGGGWILADNTAAGKVSAGTWQHIAVTVSGTTIVYYVNGIAVQTNTVAANNGLKMGSNSRLGIGGSALSAAPYVRYAGKMDDARIYNRALSATEVKALYNQGK